MVLANSLNEAAEKLERQLRGAPIANGNVNGLRVHNLQESAPELKNIQFLTEDE